MRFFFLLAFYSICTINGFAQKAKNILILYSDDQSYNTIHALGNPIIKTPHLDKLKEQGLSFLQAHVMGGHQGAVCIPSRAMLLTGRYVTRLPNDGSIIPDSLVSLPEVLQQHGYTTFHTGKWHSDKRSHNRMFKSGDNIFFGGMHTTKDGGQENPGVFHYDPTATYPPNDLIKKDTFSSQLYAETAIRFLKSNEAKEKPFICYVAFTSPHDPRTPPEKYKQWYNPKDIPLPPNFKEIHPFDNGDMNVRDENLLGKSRNKDSVKREIALYYAMVSELDEQIGRILQTLKENKLDQNTLIVFAGDNGLAVGQHGLLGKQNLYEHSIRVPMIIAGPGIPKNKQTTSFTYLSDIAPTIYDYLGIKAPSTVEAQSLMPVINNPSLHIRDQLYNVYGNWSRSIKSIDGFKLITYNVKGIKTIQLFDLKNDPWEINDLSKDEKYQSKIKTLTEALRKEMKEKGDIELWQ